MTDEIKIKCELLPMKEYPGAQSQKLRYGKYHRSNFWNVKGFGRKKWVVAFKMRVKVEDTLGNLSEKQLLKSCMKILNTPPPRKKYAKKQPRPKYGTLELYDAKRSTGTDPSHECERVYSVLAIVDTNKNKLFWGRGQSV